jgi:chromosome segregation ATPase
MEAAQKSQQPQQQETKISREEYLQIQKLNSLSNQVSQQALRIAELESQLSLASAEFQGMNRQLESLQEENNKLKAESDKLPGEGQIIEGEAAAH